MIRKLLEKYEIHWHRSNENDLKHPIWHGRAWLHTPYGVFRFEWLHGKFSARAIIDVDPEEREILLGVALPGFTYYLGIPVPRNLFARLPMNAYRKERKYPNERSIGIRVFDGAIWWSIWEDQMESRSNDPKWMRGCWHPLDTILGKTKYASTTLTESEVMIPMPEGEHTARVTLTQDSWTRPRFPFWPFRKEMQRARVDIPKGIGIPGKGENSWDCGDDAVYGLTTQASSVEEAIGKVVASALRDRIRYGGSHRFTPHADAVTK